MKKILLFSVLFLCVALTSFARTKAVKKIIKNDRYEIIITKEKTNEAVVSLTYTDGCGRFCTVTMRIFCCLTDEDIFAYAEEQALNRLGSDGCFIL